MRCLIVWLLLISAAVAAPLSTPEKHRLAAYVSLAVVGTEDAPACQTVKVGDWCPDCTPGGKPLFPSHPGKVGDGSVFETCGRCNGTQKIQASQDSCLPCSEQYLSPPPATGPWQEGGQQETPALESLPQTGWNWQGRGAVPVPEMRRHLEEEHGLPGSSVDKLSRVELEALHNTLHNEEIRASDPSCPSGNCPTSSSSGGCPSGNCPTSNSRRYGLFGRRR